MAQVIYLSEHRHARNLPAVVMPEPRIVHPMWNPLVLIGGVVVASTFCSLLILDAFSPH